MRQRNLLRGRGKKHIEVTTACPFCQVAPERVVAENALCLALRDAYPVSPGHTLVVTRRHAATYFDVSAAEQAALWALVGQVKDALDGELAPDGYNVGFNAGAAAGQTVMHVHLHVIPRRRGDVADPRGGVRGVIPARQRYAAMPEGEP